VNSEEQIRKLSLRVTAAPESSEEFRVTMDELRTGLKDSAESRRQKIKAVKNSLSPTTDEPCAFTGRAQTQKDRS
jgi:hypothetical protein